MKFLVRNSELSNAISKVVKAINSKNLGSSLEGIKFKVKGDTLNLSATDMELSIEKTIVCDTFMEGECLIPGKMLFDLVKNIEEDEDVEFFIDNGKAKITYGASVTMIQCLDVEEFPVINKDYNENSFTINQKDFKEIINKTLFSCATDVSRPIYCGELFEVKEDVLNCVALDGYRMAVYRKKIKEVTGNIRCVIPSRTLLEISKFIENPQEDMTVNIKKNSLMLDLNGTIIISRLLEGNFIDYERLIVSNFNSSFVVSKAPIKNCLDRVSIIAKDNKNVIDTSVRKESVNILAQSEIGRIDESIAINLKGSEINIGFNFKNILDVVNAIEEDFIQFDLNDSVKPCFIRPVDNYDILYMVLPIRR